MSRPGTAQIGFAGDDVPYDGIGLWHSSEALHLWHPSQTGPATEWETDTDDLHVRASQELDEGERVELYHRAQTIAAENLTVICTAQEERLNAVHDIFATRRLPCTDFGTSVTCIERINRTFDVFGSACRSSWSPCLLLRL